MSKPMLLVLLVIVIIMTSQIEWKQQYSSDMDPPTVSHKQQPPPKREEVVKEKILLSQEKMIQRLNDLVKSLQEQLQQCRVNNETMNETVSSESDSLIELEREQILEDEMQP